MALEHITADPVKVDINGSIYEKSQAEVKAIIAERTEANLADNEESDPESPSVETTLSLNPADKQTIEKGQTKDINVTTNASDFTVESNNANATVKKGSGKFTITAATKGTSEITVKATAKGGSEKVVKLSVEVTESED
ncbi:hypothetical protein F379_005 [Campylobacter phage F379]|uniref:BIG2 domain-containing protein n=1 Tax=Campylobacter phage F379 TaxID=2776767 RepID=A0A7L8ZIY1_9CAUD|nr:hypothetical protein F379_005 [Campylobacter phage F379]QXO06132.1 hypothetical protein [Campylobacter phage CJLB-12]